jgi:hypothetical protein
MAVELRIQQDEVVAVKFQGLQSKVMGVVVKEVLPFLFLYFFERNYRLKHYFFTSV